MTEVQLQPLCQASDTGVSPFMDKLCIGYESGKDR